MLSREEKPVLLTGIFWIGKFAEVSVEYTLTVTKHKSVCRHAN